MSGEGDNSDSFPGREQGSWARTEEEHESEQERAQRRAVLLDLFRANEETRRVLLDESCPGTSDGSVRGPPAIEHDEELARFFAINDDKLKELEPVFDEPKTPPMNRYEGFDYFEFCRNFRPPLPFNIAMVEDEEIFRGICGSTGILFGREGLVLKPINFDCLKNRREHFFYQFVNWCYKEKVERIGRKKMHYKYFNLLVDPNQPCECFIDRDAFATLVRFLPAFKDCRRIVKGPSDEKFFTDEDCLNNHHKSIYNDYPKCRCYVTNRINRDTCLTDFNMLNYIAIENLNSHCKSYCAMEVKIGHITYDPLASESKKLQQLSKYPKIREFGYRIMGQRFASQDMMAFTKAKGLAIQEFYTLHETHLKLFDPLSYYEDKLVVVDEIVNQLTSMLVWFETKNNNQLRFIGSSIYIVYDSWYDRSWTKEEILNHFKYSVKVRLIDFAHIFHSHCIATGQSRSRSQTAMSNSGELNKDDNFLYGLRRLLKFYVALNRDLMTVVDYPNSSERKLMVLTPAPNVSAVRPNQPSPSTPSPPLV